MMSVAQPLRRRHLSKPEFDSLAKGAKVHSQDEHGLKVLERPDGRIMKLFRRKRLMSSALFDPYANRFARASRRLAALGINACMVESLYRVPHLSRDLVIYPKVEGEDLRAALAPGAPEHRDELLTGLAKFLAMLHDRGVYYRGLHFGNILVRNGGDFALIDVSEARFFRRALDPRWRARNFRPMIRYNEDRAAISTYGPQRFVRTYLNESGLSRRRQDAFVRALQSMHELFRMSA